MNLFPRREATCPQLVFIHERAKCLYRPSSWLRPTIQSVANTELCCFHNSCLAFPVYLSSRNCWNFWPEAILRHWKNTRTQMLDFQVRASKGCSFLWHYCWKENIAYCSSLFTIIYFVILASPYRCDPEVAGTTRVSKFLFLTWHTSLENWSCQWNPEGKPLPSYFSLFRIWGYWFGFPEWGTQSSRWNLAQLHVFFSRL